MTGNEDAGADLMPEAMSRGESWFGRSLLGRVAKRVRGFRTCRGASASADAGASPDSDAGPRRARNIGAIRAGRTAFGLVLLGGAGKMLEKVFATVSTQHYMLGSNPVDGMPMSRLLGWTWLAAIVAGVVVYAIVRATRVRLPLGGAASFVVPAVGAALLLPISVHALWYAKNGELVQFERWVTLALPVTALAHAGFALMVGLRAYQLAKRGEPISVKNIYAWTVVLAALPFGIFLLFIPPILVAVTGIPIAPILVLMEPLAAPHRDDDPALLPEARVV